MAFNPEKEKVTNQHLWLQLPGFPLQQWMCVILEFIGGIVGRFMTMEDRVIFGEEKHVTSMLVEMDVSQGLPTEFIIRWGDFVFQRELNCLYVPFCCFKCQKIGHIKANYPASVVDSFEGPSMFSDNSNYWALEGEKCLNPRPMDSGSLKVPALGSASDSPSSSCYVTDFMSKLKTFFSTFPILNRFRTLNMLCIRNVELQLGLSGCLCGGSCFEP